MQSPGELPGLQGKRHELSSRNGAHLGEGTGRIQLAGPSAPRLSHTTLRDSSDLGGQGRGGRDGSLGLPMPHPRAASPTLGFNESSQQGLSSRSLSHGERGAQRVAEM